MTPTNTNENDNVISLNEIPAMRPEELAAMQHRVLKNAVLEFLSKFMTLLQNEDYEKALEMLSWSVAGDDMGTDNRYINMSVLGDEFDDIGEVVDRLYELQRIIAKENNDNET